MQVEYDVKTVMNAMTALNDERRKYLEAKRSTGLQAMEQQEVQSMERALETGELTPDLQKLVNSHQQG